MNPTDRPTTLTFSQIPHKESRRTEVNESVSADYQRSAPRVDTGGFRRAGGNITVEAGAGQGSEIDMGNIVATDEEGDIDDEVDVDDDTDDDYANDDDDRDDDPDDDYANDDDDRDDDPDDDYANDDDDRDDDPRRDVHNGNDNNVAGDEDSDAIIDDADNEAVDKDDEGNDNNVAGDEDSDVIADDADNEAVDKDDEGNGNINDDADVGAEAGDEVAVKDSSEDSDGDSDGDAVNRTRPVISVPSNNVSGEEATTDMFNATKPVADTDDIEGGYWKFMQCKEKTFQMFMYSAFYDVREQRAGAGPAVVRVIGTSERPDQLHVQINCQLWYPGNPVPENVTAKNTDIGIGSSFMKKWYRETIYVCPLKKEGIPSFVSLLCSSEKVAQFYLPVQVPEEPETKLDFGICVCASYDSRNPYQLIEWMEMQKILGVSEVNAYNQSLDDATSRIFLHYAKEGFVNFRQTRPFWNATGKTYVQPHKTPTINDCIYRNMYRYKKILVIDYDEVILPRMHKNFKDMLQAIDQDHPTNHPARSYVFRNVYFFLELPVDSNISDKLITLRHRTRVQPSKPGYSVKSIIDPQACANMHHHFCWKRTKHHDAKGASIDVATDVGMNQHYKNCHFSKLECVKMMNDSYPDDTMLSFKVELMKNTEKQLQKLSLSNL